MRKILCLTLAFLCILSLLACGGSPASVSSPEVQQTANPSAETPVAVEPQTPDPAASTPESAEPVSLGLDGLVSIDSFSFPSRYDLREIGLVTEVKDQGPYGTCWAFCLANAMESNALVRGYLRADIIAFILLFLLKVEKTIGKEQAEIKARHEANQSETIDA